MSVQASTWAWENSEVGGNALLVLLAVADAANREGENSCQSMPTLARMTRTSRATVARALKTLTELGELEKVGVHGRYKTSIYRLAKMGVTEPSDAEIEGAERRALVITHEAAVARTPSLTGDPSQSETGLTGDTPPVSPVRPNPKELTPVPETGRYEGEGLVSEPLPAAESGDLPDERGSVVPERHPSRQMTADWRPRPEFVAYLDRAYRHVNVLASGVRFRNYHFAKQSTSKSFEALLENWVSNDEDRILAQFDGGTDELGVPRTQRGTSIVGDALKPGDEGYFDPSSFSD